MKTNNGKRLIAAFVAIAMIVCAVAMVASPSDAAPQNIVTEATSGTSTTVDTWAEAVTAFETYDTVIIDITDDANSDAYITDITLTGNNTIPAGKTLIIGNLYDDNGWVASPGTATPDFQFIIAEGATLNVEGKLYNNIGRNSASSGLVVNGELVVTGNGLLYSTCTLNFGEKNRGYRILHHCQWKDWYAVQGHVRWRHRHPCPLRRDPPVLRHD